MLAALELPSTRMLLSQQAELVRLDGQRAVVRVATTWMAMVQSRLPLLEKAVATTLGSPRQLILEGAGPATVAASVVPAAARTPAQASTPTPPPERQTQTAAVASSPTPSSPTPDRARAASAAPETASAAGQLPPDGAQTRNQLDENARRLAEFFNGEVVEIDGPLEDGEAA
jgi:DNA polymerase-3 subunit gamma/tau